MQTLANIFTYQVDSTVHILPPQVFMAEPPYTSDSRTYKFHEVNDQMKENTRDRMRQTKCSMYESTIVYVVALEKFLGFYHIPNDATWDDFTIQVLASIKDIGIKLPMQMVKLAFSNEPFYRPKQTTVVNPKHGTPYELLPPFSVVNVSLGYIHGHGWAPLVKHYSCFHCGLTQSMIVKLKHCKQCRSVAYCSKECQIADWKMHKSMCLTLKK